MSNKGEYMTEFWNTKDIRPDGTYYKCDVCGEWHKFDFGISYELKGTTCRTERRIGMCKDCGRKYLAKIDTYIMKLVFPNE